MEEFCIFQYDLTTKVFFVVVGFWFLFLGCLLRICPIVLVFSSALCYPSCTVQVRAFVFQMQGWYLLRMCLFRPVLTILLYNNFSTARQCSFDRSWRPPLLICVYLVRNVVNTHFIALHHLRHLELRHLHWVAGSYHIYCHTFLVKCRHTSPELENQT